MTESQDGLEAFADLPGEPWAPSNGAEGGCFIEEWCSNCERDKVMNGSATDEDADKDPSLYCSILSNSYINPQPEWREINGKPKCLKFVKMGEALPDRCPHTLELPLAIAGADAVPGEEKT